MNPKVEKIMIVFPCILSEIIMGASLSILFLWNLLLPLVIFMFNVLFDLGNIKEAFTSAFELVSIKSIEICLLLFLIVLPVQIILNLVIKKRKIHIKDRGDWFLAFF